MFYYPANPFILTILIQTFSGRLGFRPCRPDKDTANRAIPQFKGFSILIGYPSTVYNYPRT